MRSYQSDDVTFDAGRTVLALGGLNGRSGWYRFLARHVRHRGSRRARLRRIRATVPAVAWRWLRAVLPV